MKQASVGLGGFSSSVLVHGVLLVAIFFWPSSPPVPLDRPIMQISLTMGAPGGNKLPSSVLGHQGSPAPSQTVSKPAPLPDAAPPAPAIPVAEIPKVQPKPEPAKPTPPPPEAIPLAQKKEPVPPPKPTPPKEALKPAPPKEAPKEVPKETPKDTNKPKTEPPKTPPKEAKPAVDPLKAALADAAKQSNSARPNRSSGQSVAGALADLQKKATTGNGGGGGGSGDGPGGGGIYDVYAGQVILAVRPNWSMPIYSRDNLMVQVRIKIDSQGRIIDSSIARSSGRPDFDASAVNAVIRTKILPPPPTPDQQELIVSFNSLEMAGR